MNREKKCSGLCHECDEIYYSENFCSKTRIYKKYKFIMRSIVLALLFYTVILIIICWFTMKTLVDNGVMIF